MEYGAQFRTEGPQLCGGYQALRGVLLLVSVHTRHPGHDGGTLGLLAHTAFALVRTCFFFVTLNFSNFKAVFEH